MKKFFPFLAVLLLLSLTACKKPAAPVDIAALQQEIAAADLFTDQFESMPESVLSSVWSLSTEGIEEFMVYMGTGYTGEEYGLFRCDTEETASALVAELEERIAAQKTTYADYRPEAVPRLDNAVLKQQGVYVAYVVADQYGDALTIVESYFQS